MKVPAVQWRALVLPLSVAAAASTALVWFNFVQVPRTERYLNERNLRLLRTISGQIKARVDNFDQAIDNALDTLATEERAVDGSGATTVDPREAQHFAEYVQRSGQDVEILELLHDTDPIVRDNLVERDVLRSASDPPRIRVERDEGRTFLLLGYRHNSRRVLARVDIDRVASEYFPSDSDFDALVLVGSAGRVIARQSSAGLELARVDRLKPVAVAASRVALTPSSSRSSSETAAAAPTADDGFESVRTSSGVRTVWVGDAIYQMYVQPVQLSLPSATGTAADAGVPEEWAICGFVALDRFHGASATISYTAMLWFVLALTAICVAIPLLKLQMLNARERLRRSDGVLVAVTSFVAAGALSFVILALYEFGFAAPTTTTARLAAVADDLAARLKSEAQDISDQMDRFTRPDVWRRDLKYDQPSGDNNLSLDRYRQMLATQPLPPPKMTRVGNTWGCTPAWACRDAVLSKIKDADITAMPYPFFDLTTWSDVAGQQRIKWATAAGVTPFLNVKTAGLPFVATMRRARLDPASQITSGISVFFSPNTGKRTTVFWKAAAAGKWEHPAGSDLMGQTLSANPLSLDMPVLPGRMQFAVVGRDGRVLFHSDSVRSLQENFIQECENSLPLKSRILQRHAGPVRAHYGARPHLMYVRPIDLHPTFTHAGWSLIVFEETAVSETVSVYTLMLASILFAVFGMLLALGWGVVCLVRQTRTLRWFWPDPVKGAHYRLMASTNAGCAAIAIATIYLAGPTTTMVTTAIAAIAAIVASAAIVTSSRLPKGECRSWRRDYLLARTSLLLVTSAVPALVCFHVSFAFESALVRGSEQLRQATDQRVRAARFRDRVLTAGLCGPGFERGEPCPNFKALMDKRLDSERRWARASNGASDVEPVSVTAASPIAYGLLGRLQVPFNEVGVGLTAVAALGTAMPGKAPSLWWLTLLPALLTALYALSRYVARRMFALDLCQHSPVLVSSADSHPGSVLLVGPPDSGKSTRLRRAPAARVFDVRTLAFVDRRQRRSAVPVERRATAMVVGGMPLALSPAIAPTPTPTPTPSDAIGKWTATIVDEIAAAPRETVVVIDHLEHRLDDAGFRSDMLGVLEDLLFRQRRRVWIASTCDPFAHLVEMAAASGNGKGTGPSVSPFELERWSRVLQSFGREVTGICDRSSLRPVVAPADSAPVDALIQAVIDEECDRTAQLRAIGRDVVSRLPADASLTEHDVRVEIATAAEPYYQSLWTACSTDEKLLLRHIADEGVVNLRHQMTAFGLMRKGLIVRCDGFRVMNRTFRGFITYATTADTVADWERAGVRTPWESVRTAMVTCAAAFLGFLVLTQQQLVGAWFGAVPTLLPALIVPAVPTVVNLLATRALKKEATA